MKETCAFKNMANYPPVMLMYALCRLPKVRGNKTVEMRAVCMIYLIFYPYRIIKKGVRNKSKGRIYDVVKILETFRQGSMS